METIYVAGGCLWGVQAFMKTVPGVIKTEAGRANGRSHTLDGAYDGYAECVKVIFDPDQVSVDQLMADLFHIIDPYAINKQGIDEGPKYRTGVYSKARHHLNMAQAYIDRRTDKEKIAVEVLPLTNYIPSAEEHQDRLHKYPGDYCHIPLHVMNKYKGSMHH